MYKVHIKVSFIVLLMWVPDSQKGFRGSKEVTLCGKGHQIVVPGYQHVQSCVLTHSDDLSADLL